MPSSEEIKLRNDLDIALQRISSLEEFKNSKEQHQLEYPTDTHSTSTSSIMADAYLQDKVFDLAWNKYFYTFDWLGSLNVVSGGVTIPGAWNTATGGTGSLSSGTTYVALNTGATNGSGAEMFRSPAIQGILRWDKIQRFRTSFFLSSSTNQGIYMVRGRPVNNVYYGFKINGNSLQGCAKNGGAEKTVNLFTVSASIGYDVEARFYPGRGVFFYGRNPSVNNDFIFRGSITSNFPTGGVDSDFASFYIQNLAAEVKELDVSYFEYIQQRYQNA